MGSESDRATVQPAAEALKELDVPHEVHIASAHRTPDRAIALATGARGQGVRVIIAAAGGAAHLAGVIAAHTTLPVIGIPIASGGLGGLDALLSTAQMPSGVPVATVAVNGARNAALLAARILATSDSTLARKLEKLQQDMARQVHQADARVRKAR
jgi:5-(carboxyamino)imidazole ribonucleotide mutase